MPLFEFICKKCNEKFELLVLSEGKIECPKCKSSEVTKQFSSFSSSSSLNCTSTDFCPSVVGNKHKCPNGCCHH
ncbi:MAG: zinc ribbon domain-containing protein [Endomicrobium sp.]|jgi:putative FmdB family regulatory protein|nr:zinc ribbon domain-containing protein [Endomicrobium sp.]